MIIRAEAEADLAESHAWYDRQRSGLGDGYLRAVGLAFEQIVRLPESHQVVHQDFRRAKMRRFPFLIYYRIIAGEVVIVAVLHSHRDPRVWKSRN